MKKDHKKVEKKALILLVDDEPSNLGVLGGILKTEEYNFAIATNAEETFRSINEKIPDLVLLDVMLPDIDGFEICKKLKTNAKTKDIPIIFLSARVELEDKIRGFQLGAIDYITKPFEPVEVIVRVKSQIELKFSRDLIKEYNTKLENLVEQRTKELIISERKAIFGRFMQDIIHNVRGPIGSSIAGLDLISIYGEDLSNSAMEFTGETKAKLSKMLKLSETALSNLKKLRNEIDIMLIKSRSDNTDVLEVIDFNDIIELETSFLDIDPRFKNRIKKTILLCTEKLNIKVVPGEISQVINNLLSNAIDATINSQNPKIEIKTGKDFNNAWLSIIDNGEGINEKIINSIFDSFYTTKLKKPDDDFSKPVGTGIGLHFCKKSIESYNGKITVESKENIGSTFTIYLPLYI